MDVVVEGPDGPMDGYFRATTGAAPGVVLFADALGLRDALRQMADRLADRGYHVLVPNLFFREGTADPFDPKRVFGGDQGEMARLRAMMERLPDELAMADTGLWLDWLAARPEVRRIGVVGYCLGGGFALQAACVFPNRVSAAVSIHGAGFVVAQTTPDRLATELRAPVYLGVSEIDRRHDAAVSAALDAGLQQAGVPYAIERYDGVSHGFAVPDLPVYDAAGAARHEDQVADWFGRYLR